MLRVMNWLAGLFGYEWVADVRPVHDGSEILEADEGYDDLHQHAPRYRLRKKCAK